MDESPVHFTIIHPLLHKPSMSLSSSTSFLLSSSQSLFSDTASLVPQKCQQLATGNRERGEGKQEDNDDEEDRAMRMTLMMVRMVSRRLSIVDLLAKMIGED